MQPIPPMINWTVSQAMGFVFLAIVIAGTGAAIGALALSFWADLRAWYRKRKADHYQPTTPSWKRKGIRWPR